MFFLKSDKGKMINDNDKKIPSDAMFFVICVGDLKLLEINLGTNEYAFETFRLHVIDDTFSFCFSIFSILLLF